MRESWRASSWTSAALGMASDSEDARGSALSLRVGEGGLAIVSASETTEDMMVGGEKDSPERRGLCRGISRASVSRKRQIADRATSRAFCDFPGPRGHVPPSKQDLRLVTCTHDRVAFADLAG